MTKPLGQRKALAAMAARSAVLAFDPESRSWITEADAKKGGIHIPALDGDLAIDEASLAEASDDYGHVIQRTPIAVLRPGSVDDIAKLVKFARPRGIKLAMRGQGHSFFGQAQAGGGIVIDSRTLDTIHSVSADRAVVDAGVRWIDLLEASLAEGRTPPILTDYIGLSIGGTLSVGGIGGHTHRVGLQIDNVLELEVVTGEGDVLTCSPTERADLFSAVLGGLGQFAIIVRATIPLVPAKSNARVFKLYYSDLATYTNDQRALNADERFDYLEGQILPNPNGGWMFIVEAAKYYTPPEAPDTGALLADLHPDIDTVIEEQSYFDWQNRLAPAIQLLHDTGLWLFPHPLLDLILPDSTVEAFIAGALAELDPADSTNSPMLFYPFKRSRLTRPFFKTPSDETLFLFDILRIVPPDPAVVSATLAVNRALFERARDLGGKRYAVAAVPSSHADWLEHFGSTFPLFELRKAQLDPQNLLAPGQGIFGVP